MRNNSLIKFIDKYRDKILYEFTSNKILSLFKTDVDIDICLFYTDYDYDTILKNINKDKLNKSFKFYLYKNILVLCEGNSVYFVTKDIDVSLLNIVSFIDDQLDIDNTKIYLDTDYAKSSIKKYITDKNKILNDIKYKYPKCNITFYGLELFVNIYPNKVIYGDDPVKVKDLPKKYSENITKLMVYTDNGDEIKSVYINSNHPNSKNGWFCIGKLEGLQLNKTNIDSLIDIIKIYNLTDCYYIPDKVKEYINEEEKQ